MFFLCFVLMSNSPFVDFRQSDGQFELGVQDIGKSFLLAVSIANGVGSNDLGLDRGRPSVSAVVHFEKRGKNLVLVRENWDYRAESENPLEVKAVRESFAYSVLASFEITGEKNGRTWISAEPLTSLDLNGISDTLRNRGEGTYNLDKSRSYFVQEDCKVFPENLELEMAQTYAGTPSGPHLRTVTPDPHSVTIHQHLSLVKLPDDGYKPRVFHPRSGCFDLTYVDMATAIEEPVQNKLIFRHRLQKKKPSAELSEAVEPIVYYVDSGAPKEIQDALIEGASWWAEAFEAAGFKDAFQVKLLPPEIDPMDIRYNIISWVHRSTRGWSYGGSVHDPRTGEIIKGQVILGSLRVRQDHLIFQGFGEHRCAAAGAPYFPGEPKETALDRIRQLSAHEVGHTLGFAHNFIASTQNRASVMDYPAPYILLDKNGNFDFSQAYDKGIGEWDIISVKYAYCEFDNEVEGLQNVLKEADDQGLKFIADKHSRSIQQFHPEANLWDNGSDPIAELDRMIHLREVALQRFGLDLLQPDSMTATLQEMLVPVYLQHRFQVQAAGKSLGGASFSYRQANEVQDMEWVKGDRQRLALKTLLKTLEPQFLELPEPISAAIPPRPPGFGDHRELFSNRLAGAFDADAVAETSIQLTMDVLMDPARLNRIAKQGSQQHQLTLVEYCSKMAKTVFAESQNPSISRLVQAHYTKSLAKVIKEEDLNHDTRLLLRNHAKELLTLFESKPKTGIQAIHFELLKGELEGSLNAKEGKSLPSVTNPPGSPIGASGEWHHP